MEMQSEKLAGNKKSAAVQRYLDIAEIHEDAVILKDGSLRAVLAVSSINFSLKSEDEQKALVSAYAQFLNSLDFPLEIVIQSRKLNIDEYLGRLKVAEKEQNNELLRIQITDYISFITELITLGEIMAKRFFVIVPYSPNYDKQKGFFARLFEIFRPLLTFKFKEERFAQHSVALTQRLSHIVGGLSSMGLKVERLDTQALIELYYRVYNPDLSEVQKLQDFGKIRAEETLTV